MVITFLVIIRIIFTYIIIGIAVLALFLRHTYVKTYKSKEYYEKALDFWTRNAPIEGRRGNIYDRNGNLIVGSKLTPTIVASPRQIKNKATTAKKISDIVDCTTNYI